ncbi:MAG TPA: ABC-F family ATP-binding cassette domain-containing protein [Phenylobacterium sp.]|jgi:ATPase subunit of ABC transporter with duplicated ATPase domains|nr:ABC-F family ATP-binding cassette domain-containing protein [Phenylobacterium sp.]
MPAPAFAYVTLDSLSATTPDGRPLFHDLSLSFGAERTGLVGRNGAGKTTLLRLILGEAQPTSGRVTVGGRIGLLRQNLTPDASAATLAVLLGVEADLARLTRIEAGLGGEADLAEADWTLPSRVDAALGQVGLGGLDPSRAVASMSGGQTTRAALAALLIAAPDLILLDEPTNNLDAEARELVASVLQGWKGGAIVVSHDRALLRGMDRMVELSSLGATVYGGGFDLYAARKAEEEAAATREREAAERRVTRVSREAQEARERKARRDAAGRRQAAKGGEPRIVLGAMAERAQMSGARESQVTQKLAQEAAEHLAEAEARVERKRGLAFELPSSGLANSKTVLTFKDVGFAYMGGPPILSNLSFQITGPERVAVRGPNGAGKTTLIRLATGELPPRTGQVIQGARSALLDQRAAILRDGETLVEAFRRLNPQATENAARAALARFLFRNTAADSAVGGLSGGERLRAALACLLLASEPPQLLVLDEPTNHLDLESVRAIEAALRGYDGALLVVSHDEDFLEGIGVASAVWPHLPAP